MSTGGVAHSMAIRTDADLVEHEDPWILGLRGLCVTRGGVDFQLRLTLDTAGEVVLGTPFGRSGPVHAHPGVLLTPESQDVAAALPLFGATVLSAVAFKSGGLRMGSTTAPT